MFSPEPYFLVDIFYLIDKVNEPGSESSYERIKNLAAPEFLQY
jgi:hypothetical protein